MESKNFINILNREIKGIDRGVFFLTILSSLVFIILIIFELTSYGKSPSGSKRVVALFFSPVINFFLLIRLMQLPWSNSIWSAFFRAITIIIVTFYLATI